MRVLRTTAALVTLALLSVGPAAAQPLSPLVVDWDRYFVVQPQGAVAKVWNTSLWNARNIQLLVESLDAGGQPTAQRVVWLGSGLTSGSHADVAVPMAAGSAYRVRVFAFDLDLAAGPR